VPSGGFDDGETEVKIARLKYCTGSGGGKADPNSTFPPSIPPIFSGGGNCRVSNIRRYSTLRSSFASQACMMRREEFLALSGCFSTISHSPFLRLVSAQHLAPALKARRYGPRWKMCEHQVSDSLRSNLCTENATETFSTRDLLARSLLKSVLDACSAKDRRAAPVVTSTSESFPSLHFKVNQEDW
jgi:hypothetical protein